MNINSSTNLNLHGHNKVFLDLVNLYNNKKLPNKIIFSGDKGIGKATLAYHLINYIFSLEEENKYNLENQLICKTNYSYNLIKNNTHPNFFLISNDEDKTNIEIFKIREMINYTNKSSFNNRSKIVLIDNIEYLNKNSINALLKIIEEPNSNVYFFLIHNNSKKILDTLMSRCIKFNIYLNYIEKSSVINKLMDNNFYNNLNDDFKNIYNSPGDVFFLNFFFKDNDINEQVSIDDFLKLIISKSLYKKNLYIKNNLQLFIQLYFKKKIIFFSSKDKIYRLYKYYLKKINDCNNYNLDFENILIEFSRKILNE